MNTAAKFWAWVLLLFSFLFTRFPFLFFLLEFVKVVATIDVDVAIAAIVAVVGFKVFKERWFLFFIFWVFEKEKYWIAIWLYCRFGKSMKIRIMVGLIKICVNMDEEKSREKQRGEVEKDERQRKMRVKGERKFL